MESVEKEYDNNEEASRYDNLPIDNDDGDINSYNESPDTDTVGDDLSNHDSIEEHGSNTHRYNFRSSIFTLCTNDETFRFVR